MSTESQMLIKFDEIFRKCVKQKKEKYIRCRYHYKQRQKH